jgi:hypothetical protein
MQVHYPVLLSDWYMDDWVSGVYPPANTLRHPDVKVSARWKVAFLVLLGY